MVGPTLIAWGTEAQKDRYLDPMLRGDEAWCQLFSEPGAGSDLAGLITRAEPDGEGWVVNGQKVWTSLAQHSQWAILLARTNRDAPKHRGITYFLLDMATEGVEVRPITQIDGVAHFNEVFLTDVRIPGNQVVGAVDEGWNVARTTLQSERAAIGSGEGLRFEDLRGLVSDTGGATSARVRQEVAAAFTRFELLRYLGLRVQTALSQGRPPGPESSVMKLALSATHRRHDGPAARARGRRRDAGRPRRPPTVASGSGSSCPSGRSASEAAPTRSSATSSPSASWDCRGSPRPDREAPIRPSASRSGAA